MLDKRSGVEGLEPHTLDHVTHLIYLEVVIEFNNLYRSGPILTLGAHDRKERVGMRMDSHHKRSILAGEDLFYKYHVDILRALWAVLTKLLVDGESVVTFCQRCMDHVVARRATTTIKRMLSQSHISVLVL
jgi:hypothetical protein